MQQAPSSSPHTGCAWAGWGVRTACRTLALHYTDPPCIAEHPWALPVPAPLHPPASPRATTSAQVQGQSPAPATPQDRSFWGAVGLQGEPSQEGPKGIS